MHSRIHLMQSISSWPRDCKEPPHSKKHLSVYPTYVNATESSPVASFSLLFFRAPIACRCYVTKWGNFARVTVSCLYINPFSSGQCLDRLGCRGDPVDGSTEFCFPFFLQVALVSTSGIGRDVHSLILSISSADHGIAHPPRCPEGWFWRGCRCM